MKSLFRVVVLFFAVCWGCSALAGDGSDYKFVVLGDLHFDGAAYHQTVPTKGHRFRERQRNLDMWRGNSQALLKDTAKHLNPEIPFVIQLGDITQGDCDTVALHEQMFRDAYTTEKSLLNNHRVLGIKGNHDIRLFSGKDDPTALKNAYLPILAKEAGLPELKTGNYALMQGSDLFLFTDSYKTPQGSVLEFVSGELKKHPDARYVFLVTHLPLFPVATDSPGWLSVDHVAVRDLLLTRKAVILAGHTHVFSHSVYRDKEGRILPQMVFTSVGSKWHPEQTLEKRFSNFEQFVNWYSKKVKRTPGFLKEYPLGSLPEFTIFSNLAGHAVLEVNDSGVTAHIYTGKPEPSVTLPLLKR